MLKNFNTKNSVLNFEYYQKTQHALTSFSLGSIIYKKARTREIKHNSDKEKCKESNTRQYDQTQIVGIENHLSQIYFMGAHLEMIKQD